MKLENFATQIKADNQFIKASFGGFAGSGKTRTGAEFVIGCYKKMNLTKPLLFIDNEKGSRFLIPKFKAAGIETLIKQTDQLADILTAFQLLNEGEIDFIFIDSLSKVWYQFIEQYKQANGYNGKPKAFMTLQDWGKILPDWQNKFSTRFVELNGNCVFTGRGGNTYEMEENDETHKKEFVKSGVKMKLAGETPYEPDLNIWMSMIQDLEEGRPVVYREAMILKDRSDIIDGQTFKNPTFSDFEPVIDYILSVELGEVAGASSKENLASADTYSDKKDRREIIIEKIGNEFAKAGFGTSNEHKAFKVLINEKLFGTNSLKEFEKLKVDFLENRYEDLKRFMLQWPDVTDPKAYIEAFKIENELTFEEVKS
jgi:hypothetical protein